MKHQLKILLTMLALILGACAVVGVLCGLVYVITWVARDLHIALELILVCLIALPAFGWLYAVAAGIVGDK